MQNYRFNLLEERCSWWDGYNIIQLIIVRLPESQGFSKEVESQFSPNFWGDGKN
jgi:hypothetical protein